MAEIKKRVKGFSNNGVVWEGQKDFDQTYKHITIVDKVVKTGEGENDFSIVKQVLVEETPIQEVIDADADSVGVHNIIKQVMRTGDSSLLPVDTGNPFVDAVGAPETLMELKEFGKKAEADFNGLPQELTKGIDMKSFVDSFTQEQFDAFVKAVSEREKGETKDE